jgi:AraC-like DNA-binding protein
VIDEILSVQGVIYSILLYQILNRFRKRIKEVYSNLERIRYKAISRGVLIMVISWAIGIIDVHLHYIFPDLSVDLFDYVFLCMVVCIYYISYHTLMQPQIFIQDEEVLGIAEKPISKSITVKEVQSNGPNDLIKDKLEEQYQSLLAYLEDQKPYLNPELGLQDLARELGVSRHDLSYLINKKCKKNFYDLINEHRIAETIRLMRDPENRNLTLISMAYDSGFNSKATFNRMFKKITNKTPSVFYRELLLEIKREK